jgi:hypothetical protein
VQGFVPAEGLGVSPNSSFLPRVVGERGFLDLRQRPEKEEMNHVNR